MRSRNQWDEHPHTQTNKRNKVKQNLNKNKIKIHHLVNIHGLFKCNFHFKLDYLCNRKCLFLGDYCLILVPIFSGAFVCFFFSVFKRNNIVCPANTQKTFFHSTECVTHLARNPENKFALISSSDWCVCVWDEAMKQRSCIYRKITTKKGETQSKFIYINSMGKVYSVFTQFTYSTVTHSKNKTFYQPIETNNTNNNPILSARHNNFKRFPSNPT